MKIWKLDHNGILEQLGERFDIVEKIEEADRVVLWNDVNPLERGIVNLAHGLDKKVVVMQHGRKGTSRYYPPFNEKIRADKLLVWGDFDRRSLIGAGQDETKIKVVGTTVLPQQTRNFHKGVNIIFCPEHWDREVEENLRTREELRKLKMSIITKIIESHDPKDYDNPIQSFRDTKEHLKICAEVLSTADLVVGISESTFELMAQAMDIPVVIMEEWTPKAFGGDMRYITYRRVISPAAKRATIKTLNKTIIQQLANPNELKEERVRVVLDEGGPKNALELIKYEIENA